MLVSSSVKVSSFLSAAMSSIAYLVQGYGNRYNNIDRPIVSEINKGPDFGNAEIFFINSLNLSMLFDEVPFFKKNIC